MRLAQIFYYIIGKLLHYQFSDISYVIGHNYVISCCYIFDFLIFFNEFWHLIMDVIVSVFVS